MSKDNVSDTFNRQVEDSSEINHENQKTLGTVSVPEDLANTINDLVKMERPAHVNFNRPGMFLNDVNILEKMNKVTLHESKIQRGLCMEYLAELESFERRPGAKKILRHRQKLPIYETMEEILETMHKNQVTVVYGEAGCGKTTQVPQYILDEAIRSHEGSMCKIVCALPRRISAIRAAKQVAEERGVSVGHNSPIGCYVGNNNESARAHASITYCTSGVILRQMLTDPFLNEVSHIILDEVQERDLTTDFILRLMKSLIAKRPSLKVIVLTSPVYHKEFTSYFDNCAKVKVPGFLYPVEQFFLEDVLMRTNFSYSPYKSEETLTRKCSGLSLSSKPEPYPKRIQQALNNPNADKINFELIMAVILDINHNERDGAILVFLPGVGDITRLQRMLENSFSDLIIPVHGAIINDFRMIKSQQDKIYLATNIAESGLNMNDVAYVIDTGRVKTRLFDDGYTDALKYEWITLKNVEERRRKAGRSGPGKCFHLFKRSVIDEMKAHPAPEIIRRNLEEVIIRLKVDSLGNAVEFLTKCITPIPEEDIRSTVDKLQAINILDKNENLSMLGRTLLKLSLDPIKAKMIYLGIIFSCLEPVLTIAAQLIRKSILVESTIRAERCTSDHIALYQIIKQYEETDDREKTRFCKTYHVNKYQIAKVQNTKIELASKLRHMHYRIDYKRCKFNVNSTNMNLVRAIVCAGLYPSIAQIQNHTSTSRNDITVTTPEGDLRRFHINSVNAKQTKYPSPLLVYNGIFYCNDLRYLCETTLVSPLFLILFCGKLSMNCDNSQFFLNLSENLRVHCDNLQTAKVLLGLREKLDIIIENQIYEVSGIKWSQDTITNRILRTVVDLIGREDIGDRLPYIFKT